MNLENLKIVPPEGMEWYQEGNEIKFRPKKITYEYIAKVLFKETAIYITSYGDIYSDTNPRLVEKGMYTTSKKQAEKIKALNKLMNVAKYLNEKENQREDEIVYYIRETYGTLTIDWTISRDLNFGVIYFNSRDLAQQAIEILGEETIKLALSTDW